MSFFFPSCVGACEDMQIGADGCMCVSSSGPTNSMRGAAFLASLEAGNKPGVKGEAALVVDIGGTTVSIFLFLSSLHCIAGVTTDLYSFVWRVWLDRSRDVTVRPLPPDLLSIKKRADLCIRPSTDRAGFPVKQQPTTNSVASVLISPCRT